MVDNFKSHNALWLPTDKQKSNFCSFILKTKMWTFSSFKLYKISMNFYCWHADLISHLKVHLHTAILTLFPRKSQTLMIRNAIWNQQAFSKDRTNSNWFLLCELNAANVLHKLTLDHTVLCKYIFFIWIQVCINVTLGHFCGLRHDSVAATGFCCSVHVIKLFAELKFHARFYFKSTYKVSNLAASSR